VEVRRHGTRSSSPEDGRRAGTSGSDRARFYVGFGIFVILLSFAGFAPSLIDQSRRFAPPTTLLLVHGATSLAWHRASIWIPLLLIAWSVVLAAVVAPSALAFRVGSWLLK
jgi:hypothetical protein